MKTNMLILVLMVLAGCGNPSPIATRHAMSLPAELVAIDSLMQIRPDSALTMLLNSPVDDHYYQLLLSEALYKNYEPQHNRPELLQAMAYFDSIDNAFLAARCHYMNGVGYYEMDSVVPACAEYLKALETMENSWGVAEKLPNASLPTNHIVKFIALTYTRLCLLFSNLYMQEQSIYFGKQSLNYYYKCNTSPRQLAWMLDEIGSQYEMKEVLDSASYYYRKGLAILSDTNNLTYRDLKTHLSYYSYKLEDNPSQNRKNLYALLHQAESDKEALSRCLILGELFFHESNYDSASLYLNRVYENTESVVSKKQAAEWMVETCKYQGKKYEQYANYLVQFANQEEKNSIIKSQLTELCNDFEKRRHDSIQKLNARKAQIRVGKVILGIVFAFLVGFIVYHFVNKRKQRILRNQKETIEKQLETERQAHRIQQTALGNKLKQKNKLLKELKTAQKPTEPIELMQEEVQGDYFDEAICQYILNVCNDHQKPIKSTIPISAYADIALNHEQEAQLKDAATRHFGQLFEYLKANYPKLSRKDFFYCYLCLLGLDNSQIAVMTQHSYRTIWER
ncbi:MAG: hypothetical protein IKU00_00740, partial [Bacteroidales bacterium]|nr:hypothetical protein [Bacteroidales bacterium]